jgi:hypothetical protein
MLRDRRGLGEGERLVGTGSSTASEFRGFRCELLELIT